MIRLILKATAVCIAAASLLVGAAVHAGPTSVFNLGEGLTNLEFVPIGNAGNAGELSGLGAGGFGPDAIVGAVADSYLIGKYEVTAGQYTLFLNAVAAATDTYGLYNTNMWSSVYGCKIQRTGDSGSYVYSVAGDWAKRPVNFVSWGDAARFVNWLHNGQPTGEQGLTTTEDGAYFLNGATTTSGLMGIVSHKTDAKYWIPTEDEWYKAAYHKNDGVTGNFFDYPAGSDELPGRDLNDTSGNNANYYGRPYPIDSPHYHTEVGHFQHSASPYGTFDQGGNVFEWNETSATETRRGLRGGSYYDGEHALRASYRYGFGFDPTVEHRAIGFRIASVIPEPSSVSALIGMAAVGFLWFWRRR